MGNDSETVTPGDVLTLRAFWMGRDVKYANELTDEIRANAAETVARANALLLEAGFVEPLIVTSGWRPLSVNNATIGASKTSHHLYGRAVDIADASGAVDRWCINNLDALERHELWLEHPAWTRGWCHLQTRPPRGGTRVFVPWGEPNDLSFKVEAYK